MKITRLLLSFASALLPILAFAQDVQPVEKGLDDRINDAVAPITAAVANVVFYPVTIGGINIPIVLIILIGAATYFTLYFRFPNITRFKLALNVVRGKYDDLAGDPSEHPERGEKEVIDKDIPTTFEGDIQETIRVEEHTGEVSAFQALTAALSATVGLGNIAGVAIAIAVGGPGATFWMILAGFLGMASKFTECTLGVKYREIGPDGTVFGGPMYYLKKGLGEKGWVGMGKFFAAFYAVMLVGGSFGGGNMFQANQAAAQFKAVIGTNSTFAGTAFGLVVAILVGVVIIGGIKRIGKVAEKIVPFMVGIYVAAALFILLANFTMIPKAFGEIFAGAFTGDGIVGGFLGVLIQGFRRAAFSNEAGVGSASVAHSAVKTRYPASEGIVALLEPFIDTVVVCTMTALVIVMFNINGAFDYGGTSSNVIIKATGQSLDGVNLTAAAFNDTIPGFSYVLTIAVILFAFSTMISWSYYGLQGWKYLFGRSKLVDLSYKGLFLLFIIVGAAASLGAVVDFSDAMIFAMIFPNMIGLLILAPKVKDEVARYVKAIKASEKK
ncbi:MAG: alanine/glycine:cation symporter family protein [Saprospiraceae bacterium]|nr:alanine:cation symporter family protein [Saprospiraceae bacterium]MCB9345259.1 alanine:cation symporter family protein [Lewinellaceae bacterium]